MKYSLRKMFQQTKGNFGHKGRPGMVGGSSKGSGKSKDAEGGELKLDPVEDNYAQLVDFGHQMDGDFDRALGMLSMFDERFRKLGEPSVKDMLDTPEMHRRWKEEFGGKSGINGT